ncbi:TnsA endonuclease N-terminal domain-containing protein [Brevundimonas sp. NPDC058933]|uniref:TnsA endonuclease N-terminal domain-containing protein n=1 Tax=Brevundimonas sp. NPDC058933 TaxID=3346673 RepID=UPI003BEF0B7F
MHCEVDTEVVDYRAQMFRLEFVLDGRKRTYIVDCVRLLASGVIELVEIKNDRRALKDPDYSLKLDAVRTVCDRIGWRLRVIFKSTLFGPPHIYRNISDVQSWRLTEYGKADVFEVARRLQGGVSLTLAELADALDR